MPFDASCPHCSGRVDVCLSGPNSFISTYHLSAFALGDKQMSCTKGDTEQKGQRPSFPVHCLHVNSKAEISGRSFSKGSSEFSHLKICLPVDGRPEHVEKATFVKYSHVRVEKGLS